MRWAAIQSLRYKSVCSAGFGDDGFWYLSLTNSCCILWDDLVARPIPGHIVINRFLFEIQFEVLKGCVWDL